MFYCYYNPNQLFFLQDKGPSNTLYYIVRDVVKIGGRGGYRYTIPHIGLAIEKLMGGVYQSIYTSVEFRKKYFKYIDYHEVDLIELYGYISNFVRIGCIEIVQK